MSRRIISSLLVAVLLEDIFVITEAATYLFKRYTFKKKRDDKKYKYAKQRAEVLPECQGLFGLEHTKCLRKAISPRCYNELYGADELEEGEIDVRFNSFKGCLSQEAMVSF
ncbi:hypothetical protein SNE40_021834 [Patella caerulea]|uniref:Uncharacterized protein n=1 Tax=Patella caerulea TaxID=87958 RepID=A0AAN8G8H1_PATCE